MLTKFKSAIIIGLLTLSGCGGQWATDFNQPIDPAISNQWRVVSVDVVVPDTLTVSTTDSLAPEADIVWWGEAEGDRRAQVAAIIEAGVAQGSRALRGSVPVHFLLVLEQFHATSPRAQRIAPSAVHNISYTVRVFDSRNGQELTSAVHIDADLEAYVGAQLAAAQAQGGTERSRIIAHIAAVTAGWLGISADPRREFSMMGR